MLRRNKGIPSKYKKDFLVMIIPNAKENRASEGLCMRDAFNHVLSTLTVADRGIPFLENKGIPK